jgi:hypothetical protein
MRNLDQTAKELFAKIRGRFPGVTIGNADGNVTQEPTQARFFEFPFKEGDQDSGKISISLGEEDGVVVMYNQSVAEDSVSKSKWFDFLKELRQFSKKRMLNFSTRDITKSNLERRDYKYLATRSEDSTMTESKLYGTSKVSYQDIDSARLVIKHTESVNQELASGRTQKIGKIYVESADGERFMYPYRHLNGARAMARHVAEGGKPYDDFGKHITGLSEELVSLRKFKNYMGRSAVMAESLSEYMDVVKERIATVKKTVESLQKASFYKEAAENYQVPVMEDVPADVAENWIDQLTIRQFNEELADVFPYIYKLVSEATKAKELSLDDVVAEADDPCWKGYKQIGMKKKGGKEVPNCVPEEIELEAAFEKTMGQFSEAKMDPAKEKEVMKLFTDFEDTAWEHGAAGSPDLNKAMELVRAGKLEAAAEEVVNSYSGDDGEEVSALDDLYQDLVDDLKFVVSNNTEGDDTIDVKMTPDGGIEKADAKEQKTPLGEFILSYFDKEEGQFPKGETAVLTMVEKDYGEEFIEPAKAFIEMINDKVAEVIGYREGTVTSVGDAVKGAGKVGVQGNQGGKVGLSTKDDNPFAGNVGKKAPAGHKSAADKLKSLKGEETERLRKLAGL